MLDKTIPYAEIWMHRSQEIPVVEQTLPVGFHFEFYEAGDELQWAAIETAVCEFENEIQALDYFREKFAPYPEELRQRMLFITDSSGEKVATCSAWWKELPNGNRYPLIHWVAVKPSYQGKGIAKALITHTLKLLQKLEDGSSTYLHTQTWSYIAIRLYQKLGFNISNRNLDGSHNLDYQKTLDILAKLEN